MQTASTTAPAPVQAESTFNFINSIGVDTHNNDGDDTYATLSSQFVSEFQYLGLNLAGGSLDAVGLAGGGLAYLQKVESEMAQGIRFDFAIGGGTTPIPVSTVITNLNLLETADPGMITFVTGQNEVGEGDPNINADIVAAQNYQDQLYAAIKADPLLSSVGDITYSVGSMNPSAYTSVGNQSANTQYGNAHIYSAYFPPQIYDSYYALVNNSGTPNDPFVVTETGYPDNPWPGAGLSDDVVAKYQLDNIFDLLLDGASTVEVYELLDQANDPNDTVGSEDHFGFFTYNGQPKESAVALHNLTTILADPGSNKASFQAGTLSYSTSGLNSAINPAAAEAAYGYGIFNTYIADQPIYGASYLLEKSNGTFDIAVWQEPEIWDNTTATPIPDSAHPVTIMLGQTAQSIEVYDPLVGTSPIATYSDVSSVTVMVSDHPLIVEVDPFAAGSAPAPAAPPLVLQASVASNIASSSPTPSAPSNTSGVGTVALGSGPDTLALSVSERAEDSGAQFTISVDGQQVGGVQTTSASSLAGQSQTFDVMGNFGSGSHDVSIDYLNASNSLLYVNGTTLDGNSVPGGALTLSNNGPVDFGFSQAGAMTAPATVEGSGPDSLVLSTSERSEPSGAQFTVSVDGQQIGGVQTTTADSTAGQQQQLDVLGNFAPGSHTASVDYLNASNSLLYVNAASINGATVGGGSLTESNNGSFGFNFVTPSAPPPTTIGSGPDTLGLNIAEDYYNGDAQFTVSVDGQQVGGTQTATAIAGNGQSQMLDVLGNFSGAHTVSINFLNDASTNNPGPGTDRNLYVGGATIDGTNIANSSLALLNTGAQSFSFNH